MSEIVATIALLGIGYLISHKKDTEKGQKETFMNNSLASILDAEKVEKEAAVASKARDHFIASTDEPFQSSPNNTGKNDIISQLTGLTLNKEEFKTRNDGQIMEPFFGKNVTQNTRDLNIPNRLLEPNGLSDFTCKKTEQKPFFAPTSNLTNVNGAPSDPDTMKQRYYATNKRQGELPFEQVRVAPGLGQNYGTEGSGGFQQLEIQELIRPKNVDELRSKSNPKLQYKGRVVTGKRNNDERGKTGAVEKNRPDKFYENSEKRYFKSQASVLKQSAKENYDARKTNRQYSRHFVGGAKAAENKPEVAQKVKESTKNVYIAKEPSNMTATNQWNDIAQNYGKASFNAYPNERDITQRRTNRLNLTKIVKNLITPVQDLMRTTKKENFVGNNRPEGNMNASMPKKMTVYDPNDVAKTTIKETTIDNKHTGTMNGPKKLTVYDPNDIAKTTVKETTIDNKHNGHVASLQKNQKVKDYDTKPKTTTRETLDNVDNNLNLYGPQKLQTFDRANPPKKTTKETTVEDSRTGFMGASRDLGKGGYQFSNIYAPNTSKQFLSNNEYTGIGGASVKNHRSYDSSYNASLNINKEQIARGRAPSKQGAKVANGSDKININVKKQLSGASYPKMNKKPLVVRPPTIDSVKLSHRKDQLNNDMHTQRIQPEVLSVLKENPYSHSITDVGPEVVLNMKEDLETGENMKKLQVQKEQDEIEKLIEDEIAKLI